MITNYVFGDRDILVIVANHYSLHSRGNDSMCSEIFGNRP